MVVGKQSYLIHKQNDIKQRSLAKLKKMGEVVKRFKVLERFKAHVINYA